MFTALDRGYSARLKFVRSHGGSIFGTDIPTSPTISFPYFAPKDDELCLKRSMGQRPPVCSLPRSHQCIEEPAAEAGTDRELHRSQARAVFNVGFAAAQDMLLAPTKGITGQQQENSRTIEYKALCRLRICGADDDFTRQYRNCEIEKRCNAMRNNTVVWTMAGSPGY
jgi:hypothetical protein